MPIQETDTQEMPVSDLFCVVEQTYLPVRLKEAGFPPASIGPLMVAASALAPLTSDKTKYDIRDATQFTASEGLIRIQAPYFVIGTGSLSTHPHYANADALLNYLAAMSADPWRGHTGFAKELICDRAGFEHLPPLFMIVAQEADFAQFEGFQHGRSVSVVDAGLKIGKIESIWDVPFITVFGSRYWEDKEYFRLDSRIENTREHEIGHLLTLFAAYQIYKGHINDFTQNRSVSSMFSIPAWEALANLLCNRIKYTINEQRWHDDPSLLQDLEIEEPLLDHKQKEAKGNDLVNELLLGILLRVWQGENIERIQWDRVKGKKAAQNFLLRIHGGYITSPKDESNGWLLRQVFEQDSFDWQEAVESIRGWGNQDIARILEPIRNQPGGQSVASFLQDELDRYISFWDPFGNKPREKP